MKNKKIAGRKMHNETRRRGYRGMRRRNECTANRVSEVGRCNKKSRILTGTGFISCYPCRQCLQHRPNPGTVVPFPNLEIVALSSRGENAPTPMNLSYPTNYSCLPQAKLTAKDFQPPDLGAWSPNSSSSNTREIHVEETCLIDFPSKKEVVEDASMDFVNGFVDEEDMFDMPGLINGMAEGMLLTPPAMKRGFKWSHDVDDANYINLWAE